MVIYLHRAGITIHQVRLSARSVAAAAIALPPLPPQLITGTSSCP